MAEIKTKEEVLDIIAKASFDGYLGLFVGAGFSKAVVEDTNSVLNWEQLVDKVFKSFENEVEGFNYENDINKVGKSFPEITTEGINILSSKTNNDFNKILEDFKVRISAFTAWLPSEEKSKEVNSYLKIIDPKWIITTNYDNVLEYILPDEAYTISPDDVIIAPNGLKGIYHIHGTRINPSSIIIAQNDYIKLFRPNDYRVSKLSNLFLESTTIFLGYGLGDVNILSSIDLAKNFYNSNSKFANNNVIQFVRSEFPKNDCYLKDGVIIYEIKDITEELNFISKFLYDYKKKKEIEITEINETINLFFNKFGETEYLKYYEDNDFKDFINSKVFLYSPRITTAFSIFLRNVFELCWKKCSRNGAWEEYSKFVNLIVKLIIDIQTTKNSEPLLLNMIVNELNKLKDYVGTLFGQSKAAYRKWEELKPNLSPDMIRELKSISFNKGYFVLINFLSK